MDYGVLQVRIASIPALHSVRHDAASNDVHITMPVKPDL